VAVFIFLKTTIHTPFSAIYPGKTQPVAGYTGQKTNYPNL